MLQFHLPCTYCLFCLVINCLIDLEQDGSVDIQCTGGAKVSDLIEKILTLPDDIDIVVVHV